jgi:hypothetical protein
MGRPGTQKFDSTKNATHYIVTFTSAAGDPSDRPGMPGIADVSVMDLIDETRRVAITSPGAFLGASARYHSMNSGSSPSRLPDVWELLCFPRRR